jgi:hypothetical protein
LLTFLSISGTNKTIKSSLYKPLTNGIHLECTSQFLNLSEDSPPTLNFSNNGRHITVYMFDQNLAILRFFSDMLETNIARLRGVAGAYARAQPGLTGAGPGWAVTRFAGAEHLSLQLGDEVYFRKVPKEISKFMVCRAKAEKRFLNCSIEMTGKNHPESMPLTLAHALAG